LFWALSYDAFSSELLELSRDFLSTRPVDDRSFGSSLDLARRVVAAAGPVEGRALLSAEEVKPLSEGASVGAVRGGVVSNDVLREGALVVLRSRGFIPAVKYVRETAGWGLLESKAFVDGLRV
jgi:ribosomal protein L7/L12